LLIDANMLAKLNNSSGIKINKDTTSVIIEIDKLNELYRTMLLIVIATFLFIVLFSTINPSAFKSVNSLFTV